MIAKKPKRIACLPDPKYEPVQIFQTEVIRENKTMLSFLLLPSRFNLFSGCNNNW